MKCAGHASAHCACASGRWQLAQAATIANRFCFCKPTGVILLLNANPLRKETRPEKMAGSVRGERRTCSQKHTASQVSVPTRGRWLFVNRRSAFTLPKAAPVNPGQTCMVILEFSSLFTQICVKSTFEYFRPANDELPSSKSVLAYTATCTLNKRTNCPAIPVSTLDRKDTNVLDTPTNRIQVS